MRTTGRVLAETVLVILMIAVCLACGFIAGRDYERINAIAAEPTPPVVTIGKRAAAARIDPICRVRQPRKAGTR